VTRITAVLGDLTTQQVDAVVNAANERLAHGGGVAAAIFRAGGPTIQTESDAWLRRHGPLTPGQAAITSAGAMAARWVVHVAGPIHHEGQDNAGLLATAVCAALDAAVAVGARSVALPAISAGIYGYPLAEATAVIAGAVTAWCPEHLGALDEVRLVGYGSDAVRAFERGLSSVISPQSSVLSHQSSVISPQSSVISPQSSGISHQPERGVPTED
jgi:O-acetyl-ADP-ribose deacetylase (regulator of RNase III)